VDVQLSDLLTVGLLVVLEGLLSADNALVVAVMILGLPLRQQKKALLPHLPRRLWKKLHPPLQN